LNTCILSQQGISTAPEVRFFKISDFLGGGGTDDNLPSATRSWKQKIRFNLARISLEKIGMKFTRLLLR